MMRNICVDFLAGILITIQAIYDFGTPWCYFFVAFSIVILFAEAYIIIKAGQKDTLANGMGYRHSSIDWFDAVLGVVIAFGFAEWFGVQSAWFYVGLIPCVIVTANSIYNLYNRNKNGQSSVSLMNVLKSLAELI
jgi:hypothetical protein